MSETEIMRSILVAVSDLPSGLFWRQNVGVGVAPGKRIIRFGLPGMADIGGIYQGRHVEIEVKAPRGRQSVQQQRWQRAVERAGGVYILARSPQEALDALAQVAGSGSTNHPVTEEMS